VVDIGPPGVLQVAVDAFGVSAGAGGGRLRAEQPFVADGPEPRVVLRVFVQGPFGAVDASELGRMAAVALVGAPVVPVRVRVEQDPFVPLAGARCGLAAVLLGCLSPPAFSLIPCLGHGGGPFGSAVWRVGAYFGSTAHRDRC
jgi:hypothetical protein